MEITQELGRNREKIDSAHGKVSKYKQSQSNDNKLICVDVSFEGSTEPGTTG